MYMFGLSVLSDFTDTDLKVADANILDVGDNWVDVDDTTGSVGDMIYVTTNDAIEPRQCIREVGISGGSKYTLDRTWNIIPSTADDVNWRQLRGFGGYAVVVYEDHTTDFNQVSGAL